MRVGVIQAETIFASPQKNRLSLEPQIDQLCKQGIDCLLLPETWNVGFFPNNVREIVSQDGEASISWLKGIAEKYQINVVGGSIAYLDGEQLVNRAHIFNRSGELVATYDKIHLFSPGREATQFEAGEKVALFELDGVRCGIEICYDLRFPELSRRLALEGAEVIFIPAQWPHPRSMHWQALARARAIENQLFVVTCNGCGHANQLVSCGYSAAYAPFGEILEQAGETAASFIATLNLKSVAEAREKIPVFKDRLPHLY